MAHADAKVENHVGGEGFDLLREPVEIPRAALALEDMVFVEQCLNMGVGGGATFS